MLGLLAFDFVKRAFAAGVITALLSSVVGVFVVLRRMSMIGDSLSHAALAGVAAGALFGFYPLYGAIGASVISALLIELIRRYFSKYEEIALAVVMSGGMGLAVVLISLGKSFNTDLASYLFGSLGAVSSQDIRLIGGLGLFIIVSVGFLYRELFAVTLDEEAASLLGIPVRRVNLFFTVLTSISVAVSVRIVGALLVSALMVIPAAVSLQLARSFKETFIVAAVVALFSVVTGLYGSLIFDAAPGGTIVLVAVGVLVTVLIIKEVRSQWT